MFDNIKSGLLKILYSASLPIAKWSAKRLIKYPPPTEKEEFRQWALWLCRNRLVLVVQQTPTELDDKALTVLENVLENDILYTIVWNKLNGVDPEPDKVDNTDNTVTLSFFERVRAKIKSAFYSTNTEDGLLPEDSEEAEAQVDAEAGSVVTAIWIFSLLLQTPSAIKTLTDLIDFVKNRLGVANGDV
jgi:hypothetical protein